MRTAVVMVVVVQIGLALLVVILTINYLLVRQNIKYGRHIPGPVPLPIVGCFYLYINLKPEGTRRFRIFV